MERGVGFGTFEMVPGTRYDTFAGDEIYQQTDYVDRDKNAVTSHVKLTRHWSIRQEKDYQDMVHDQNDPDAKTDQRTNSGGDADIVETMVV